MQAWEDDLLLLSQKRAAARSAASEAKFHLLGWPADALYINSLHSWAMRASPRDADALSGREPPFWGEEEKWMREQTPLIKKAARELGARERGEIKTLEELGFNFEAWKRAGGEVGMGEGETVGGGAGDTAGSEV
jgi:hypothetical protein